MNNTDNNVLYEKARAMYQKYKGCKELQIKLNIKTAIAITGTILWYIIWTTSAISYFQKPWATFNPKNILVYITVAMLIWLPKPLFKLHKNLPIKPFAGIIDKIDYSITKTSRASAKHYFVLKMKSLDGKTKKKLKLDATSNAIKFYSVGMPVIVVRGLTAPIPIENGNKPDAEICYYCGKLSPPHYDRCFHCSTPLWHKDS